jgi:cysteine desulfurase
MPRRGAPGRGYNSAVMAAVYLDHNSTTPLDPRVREAMLPWLGASHGNPSSLHRFGQAARNAVEEAREQVAALLGASPPEVVFTASGTEANNAVLASAADVKGARDARDAGPGRGDLGGRGHLVISALEHPSIRESAARLERGGMAVTRVPPAGDGVVPAGAVTAALRADTRLVCLMLANNEVGTVQPVEEVAAECRHRGIAVLCDAVQAVGKIAVRVDRLGVDFLTLGGHKFHGPLGAAALWVRGGRELAPLLVGGSQERRRRAGTENVPAIVGLGAAAAIAMAELAERHAHLAALRDRCEDGLAGIPGAAVHCRTAPRLPNTSHVSFAGVEGESLLIRLDIAGFAVSTGSACASGTVEPSQTLLAMGLPVDEALSSLRVSFGMTNTAREVDAFLAALAREVAELRRFAPSAARPSPAAGAVPAAVALAAVTAVDRR